MQGSLRVALGEYDLGWQSPEQSVERAAQVVERAAAAQAGLVVLPEMCLTGFTMEPAVHAESLDGPNVRALARLAIDAGVSIIASIARAAAEGGTRAHFNSVVHVAPTGAVQVVYDKQKLFAYGGEDAVYTPGDRAPTIVDVNSVRIAPFVCYDLRFPELFRAVADGADLITIVANWPAARRPHWDVLLRARAIENQCYVIGVNRTGRGGSLEYDGGSAAYDAWGDRADFEEGGIRVVDVDAAKVGEIRGRFPFLRDRTR